MGDRKQPTRPPKGIVKPDPPPPPPARSLPGFLTIPEVPSRADVVERVVSQFHALNVRAGELCRNVEAMPCGSERDRMLLIDGIRDVKSLAGEIDKARKDNSTPFRKLAEAINAFFAPAYDRCARAEKEAKDRVTAWQRQEFERRERLLEEQRRVEAKAAAAGAIVKPREAPAPVSTSVQTGSASSSTSSPWKFRVTDPDAVPRDLCVPDPGLIRGRMQSDVKVLGKPRDVSGVEFYREDRLAVGGAR